MNCRGWAPHIALYVEGDLEGNLSQQVEAHLALCDACSNLANDLKRSQADLRQLRSEIVEPSSLNRVRTAVLDEVRRIEQHRTWIDRLGILLWSSLRWRYAGIGIAVMAIVVVTVLWRIPGQRPAEHTASVESQPDTSLIAANTAPEVQAEPATGAGPAKGARTAKRTVTSHKPAAPAPAVSDIAPPEQHETLVQILTDDPNVVIYWLIDQTGGF